MTYRLFCYGKPYSDVVVLDAAKAIAEEHIRTCPEGAMKWARLVRWHEVGPATDERFTHRSWVSAAKREWLDHRIDEVIAETNGVTPCGS